MIENDQTEPTVASSRSWWRSHSRWRAAAVAAVAGIGVITGVGLVAPAVAAPYANCNRPVYNGAISATARCDAASAAKVRLWARCFIGPFPSAEKFTSWTTVPAGTYRTIRFASHGWCGSFGQQWMVIPQVYGE